LATAEGMRRRAEIEDEGRYAVLGFSAAAAIAILLAIVFELHGIKDRPSALAVVLAAATILLSWLFMNTISRCIMLMGTMAMPTLPTVIRR
jgi:uncharacterized membrane protein